jgi:hypothetical protein
MRTPTHNLDGAWVPDRCTPLFLPLTLDRTTYQFRESIHRRRVMLRTFSLFPFPYQSTLSYLHLLILSLSLSYLSILSYLIFLTFTSRFPHHFHTCFPLAFSSLLTCLNHDSLPIYTSRLLLVFSSLLFNSITVKDSGTPQNTDLIDSTVDIILGSAPNASAGYWDAIISEVVTPHLCDTIQ